MPTFPDISEYYTPLLALHEDQRWLWDRSWREPREFLQPLLGTGEIKSIVEFGCGSGLLAAALPTEIAYCGIDKNNFFLDRARRRNHRDNAFFQNGDVRNFNLIGAFDLSMSWNVLKHFALDEFDEVLTVLLRAGRRCAFSMQLADKDFDDGTAYHHSFVRYERIVAVLDAAGYKIVRERHVNHFDAKGTKAFEVNFFAEPRERVNGFDVGTVTDKRADDLPPCLQSLSIEDNAVSDLDRYAVRWVKGAEGAEPKLYKDGKRVAKAWRLKMEVVRAADGADGNANTAD